ncbi:MAG: DUF2177 family protein [Oceanicaulis sp.]
MIVVAWIAAWFATALVFLALDALWLGVIAKRGYRKAAGPVLAENYDGAMAVVFYVIYVTGAVLFGLAASLFGPLPLDKAFQGAAFGLFAYAAVNFTNAAVLKAWPRPLAFVDTFWGTFLTGVSVFAGAMTLQALGG